MKDLRNHIKEHEEEIASLHKQVRTITYRSKTKKLKPTKRIKLYMKNGSGLLKILRKQNNFGLMPRRRARQINQQLFRNLLQV